MFKFPTMVSPAEYKTRMQTVQMAHSHLIRSIISLVRLKHRFFYSIDVCGKLKVWSS